MLEVLVLHVELLLCFFTSLLQYYFSSHCLSTIKLIYKHATSKWLVFLFFFFLHWALQFRFTTATAPIFVEIIFTIFVACIVLCNIPFIPTSITTFPIHTSLLSHNYYYYHHVLYHIIRAIIHNLHFFFFYHCFIILIELGQYCYGKCNAGITNLT